MIHINTMRRYFLYLLLLLLAFPVLSQSAEMCTLEIAISFNSSDSPDKQHIGYKLFQDGTLVCNEAVTSDTSSIICKFPSEYGTFDFTLTASYSDNTESPPSPSFPFTLNSPNIDDETVTTGEPEIVTTPELEIATTPELEIATTPEPEIVVSANISSNEDGTTSSLTPKTSQQTEEEKDYARRFTTAMIIARLLLSSTR